MIAAVRPRIRNALDKPESQSRDPAVILAPTVEGRASSGASLCGNDDSTKDERGGGWRLWFGRKSGLFGHGSAICPSLCCMSS
jgi:hypothetical protein